MIQPTATHTFDLPAIERDLTEAVRGEIRTDIFSRGIHATDASHYQIMPTCVVNPRDEADCVAAVKVAAKHSLPMTARGAGTSLSGQTHGVGMIIDVSQHMDKLIEVNEEERWARVQPGIVRDRLNAQLRHLGLHYAPDPATGSRATVGGIIGNNSSGTRSILYGKAQENLLACRVLLADGTLLDLDACDWDRWCAKSNQENLEGRIYSRFGQIIAENRDEIEARFPKVMRRVGGYNLDAFLDDPGQTPWNLSNIIVGSEGTLGILIEAKVKLVENPKATALCVVHFDELLPSLRCLPAMLEHGPSAVELLDHYVIDEAIRNPATKHLCHFMEGHPKAVQIVEFYGDDQAHAASRAEAFAESMRQQGVGFAQAVRRDPKEISEAWDVRKLGLGLIANTPGPRKALDFVDDACIPIEHLAEYVERLLKVCEEHGTSAAVYAHASVGVLHIKPLIDLHYKEEQEKMRSIAWAAFEMCKEYGGSWSGEHGDGLVRGEFVRPFFGDQLYEAFKQVRALFDPRGLMNPNKILDTPLMTEHLRYGDAYRLDVIDATESRINYHYRDQGGFASAVEQCSGVGACRKVDVGTMCPSYMATRDEEASTRGRANALRMAMSGQLGPDAMTDKRMKDVLGLCLACKSCKTECPNSVDMAKMKSDVLQMMHDRFGLPLGYRLMGDSPTIARLVCGPLAPIVNWVQGLTPMKKLLEAIAGIDARRPAPKFATWSLQGWFRRHRKPKDDRPEVVLFDDTYASYFEPHVGVSAVELLEGCGYKVTLARAGCCQRPRLSKGMVRAAKKAGEKTLRNLDKYAREGLPIVCLEPSCASSLADDLPDLIDDVELGKRVAPQVMMIDEFLAAEAKAGRINATIKARFDKLMIHGHCHQKSLNSTQGMKDVLDLAENVTYHEVDSGCCGMAGSFGYEEFEVSKQVYDLRLGPAIEKLEPGEEVVACGFSCRHQLSDFSGLKAYHWVEVVSAENSNEPR
ncbi:FAD-binding and (Fe-S)-binding domain-containing protein [Mucisphaera calidilacus]|uniref:Anaerobic glycerol-3-phosphate dehydrogenase subunit C n=1 Tax=Mucisphaera calidilacus TaxID=2527982 RepID=A0A518BWL7_9BACT|nr:FAD-binding and (Fe-S)-binding domain-containing protein [Mucisphaera calidilacus]QDU71324.1 Anaerobic glycerol-3-phosphate dehydrogenase subunit C [Mucisphaera calidilacus]